MLHHSPSLPFPLRLPLHALLACIIVLLMVQGSVGWTRGPLNVHIVPHSHNDPGWWRTFEGYYQDWTKGIISSVVEILTESATRTFIWAEISYFQRWWDDQPNNVKANVKKLVANGQLEFVTAGWVMNDEANTHVVDIINQLTEGHEWLYKTLNTKPKYGWAIDPFGHSPTMPYVLQQMGFEAMVINRAHRQIKEEFRNSKHLEFMWSGDLLNSSSSFNILTHMLPWKLYDIPNTCGPDWGVCEKFDFERPEAIPITKSNVKERAAKLVEMYKAKAQLFRHNSVLIPLGDDFKYKNPEITRKMFTQYEMLIDAINEDASLGVNIKFSSLGQYFEEVQAEFPTSNSSVDYDGKDETLLPPYQGDFFTYCDEGEDYWSGYFTTRPFMKGLTRSTQAILRSGEILSTLARSYAGDHLDQSQWGKWFDSIQTARRNVALFQHHDGVTGTARRAVVEDYADRLLKSLAQVAEYSSDMALVILSKSSEKNKAENLAWITEPAKSISLPTPRIIKIEKSGAVLVVFNSLTHLRSEVVSVLVNTHEVEVIDYEGKRVVAQVDPVWDGDSFSTVQFMLHFVANVPGIGIATYFLRPTPHATLSTVVVYSSKTGSNKIVGDWDKENEVLDGTNAIVVENNMYRVTLNGFGTVKDVTRTEATGGLGGLSADVNQEFLEYSSRGGAYLFLPAGSANPLALNTERVYVTTGPIVKTVHSYHQSSVKELIVRLYECTPSGTQRGAVSSCPQSQGIELIHMVDLTKGDTEVVTRFKTNIANKGRFYTDSNGFEMRERDYTKNLPIQGNYYPITAAAYIETSSATRSGSARFTVLSHQAHGVTSLNEGELEVMLDRRLNRDDARGLGEPVIDNVRTRIPLWLVVEAGTSVNSFAHPALSPVASQVWHAYNYPLHTLYSYPQSQDSTSLQESWKSAHHLRLDPLSATIDEQLQILSLAPRDKESDDIIFRVFRPPVQVDMSSLAGTSAPTSSPTWSFDNTFKHFTVTRPKETSLSLLHEKRTGEKVDTTIDPTTIKTWIVRLSRSAASIDEVPSQAPNIDPKVHITEKPAEESSGEQVTKVDEKPAEESSSEQVKKVDDWKVKETDPPVDDSFIEKVKANSPLHENDDEPAAADDTELIIPPENNNENTNEKTTKDSYTNNIPNNSDDNGNTGKINRVDEGNEKTNLGEKRINEDFPRPNDKLNRGNGEGRIGNVKDESLQLRDQGGKVSNATGMYTMSIVIYLGLLVIAVLGGWLLGRRRTHARADAPSSSSASSSSSSAPRAPSAWQDREDSLMKLL